MESKSNVAAQEQKVPTDVLRVAEIVDPAKVVKSEDVEQEECFTF